MQKTLLFLGLLMGGAGSLQAQRVDTTVTRLAHNFMASGPEAGCSIGIVKDGVVYKYHFGVVNKQGSAAPVDGTIYEIGSVTKTFTSLLLAHAVEEQKLALGDDLRKHLPGDYPNLNYEGIPVQVLHLANLTSRLPDNLPEKMPAMKSQDPDAQLLEIDRFHASYTKAQFLSDLHLVTLKEKPGVNPAHSNTAAELMGFMLEHIYGNSYDGLLKKYITGPLKMGNTFVTVPSPLQANAAPGYNDKGLQMPVIPQDAGSAGVLKSSLPDMIKYLQYQLYEKDSAVKLTHQPTWGDPDDQAIGLNWWVRKNFDGYTRISTSGGTFGQACYIGFYPARQFGIVILTNENDRGAEGRISDMAQAVYNELFFTPEQRAAEGFGFSASVNKLWDALNKEGFEHATEIAKTLKQSDPSFKLTEDEVNSWGYNQLFKKQAAKAVAIFKLNVSLYPQSPNTYDSLAEACEVAGDTDGAIRNYQRELELAPGNKQVEEHLAKLTAGHQ